MSDHWFLDWSARPSSLHTPASGTASSNREGGGGIPRDSGRKTRDNPPVSHLSASYLPLAGHRSPPRLNLYRRRFEWREDPLLPGLLLSTISPINYSFSYSFYSVFFEKSEPSPREYRDLVSKGIRHNLARREKRYRDVPSRESITVRTKRSRFASSK